MALKSDFPLTPESGLKSDIAALPKSADFVAKVFLGWRTKILKAADAFCARRHEGPHRFIQNRSRISAVALNSDAVGENSKINFREIFRVVRFSTFATKSARFRHVDGPRQCPLMGKDRK